MKRNAVAAMDRMEIDAGIRQLINLMWRHGYRTLYSCEGHGNHIGYVCYLRGTGDSWFEKNAHKFGFGKFEFASANDPITKERIKVISYYTHEVDARTGKLTSTVSEEFDPSDEEVDMDALEELVS